MKNLAKSRIHEEAAGCGHELTKSKKHTIQMNFTVRLKLLPSEAVYLSVSQMSGCPQMSVALKNLCAVVGLGHGVAACWGRIGSDGHWRMGQSGFLPSNAGRTRNLILQTEATAKTAKTHRMRPFCTSWPVLAVLSVGVAG